MGSDIPVIQAAIARRPRPEPAQWLDKEVMRPSQRAGIIGAEDRSNLTLLASEV